MSHRKSYIHKPKSEAVLYKFGECISNNEPDPDYEKLVILDVEPQFLFDIAGDDGEPKYYDTLSQISRDYDIPLHILQRISSGSTSREHSEIRIVRNNKPITYKYRGKIFHAKNKREIALNLKMDPTGVGRAVNKFVKENKIPKDIE